MTQTDTTLRAALAVTRFGLGAKPGEIARVAADPTAWLMAQVRREGAAQPAGSLPATTDQLESLFAYQQASQQRRRRPDPSSNMEEDDETDPVREARRQMQAATFDAFVARAALGATTDAGFAERWALFWANWFTVSAQKFQTALVTPQFEAEAIRPHVFGTFEQLLLAVESHPAMLLYLDQAQSVGPNSVGGQRREAGLNENLAREILELHTVGVDGGYTQADVTEFARALTGWSVLRRNGRGARQAQPMGHGAVFQPLIHEPGDRAVMGHRYGQAGRAQATAVLRDLAAHPATARRAAYRIAAHFVSDTPPPTLVDRLERSWVNSGGDLAEVARTLIQAPEAWEPAPGKIKTPYEFVISSWRVVGLTPRRPAQILPVLRQLGQPPYSPPSPEGWPDDMASWAAPDAVVRRLSWAERFADQATPTTPPVEVAQAALGGRLGERTRLAVSRAERREEALTLLLMSPEFQRR